MKCYIRYADYDYEGQDIRAVFATLEEAMKWRDGSSTKYLNNLDIFDCIMLIEDDDIKQRWTVTPVTHEWVTRPY